MPLSFDSLKPETYLQSSDNLKQNVVQHVKQKNWKKLVTLLESNRFEKEFFFYRCTRCTGHHHILNLILKFRPTVDILKQILEYFPDAANQADCRKRIPLHYGLQFGLPAEGVKFLLKMNKKTIDSKDFNGDTPLELLLQHYEHTIENDSSAEVKRETQKYVYEVIMLLSEAKPTILLDEDKQGRTIVEYTMEHEFDSRIIVQFLKLTQISSRSLVSNEGSLISSSDSTS